MIVAIANIDIAVLLLVAITCGWAGYREGRRDERERWRRRLRENAWYATLRAAEFQAQQIDETQTER